jgi:hypothetical protein
MDRIEACAKGTVRKGPNECNFGQKVIPTEKRHELQT